MEFYIYIKVVSLIFESETKQRNDFNLLKINGIMYTFNDKHILTY